MNPKSTSQINVVDIVASAKESYYKWLHDAEEDSSRGFTNNHLKQQFDIQVVPFNPVTHHLTWPSTWRFHITEEQIPQKITNFHPEQQLGIQLVPSSPATSPKKNQAQCKLEVVEIGGDASKVLFKLQEYMQKRNDDASKPISFLQEYLQSSPVTIPNGKKAFEWDFKEEKSGPVTEFLAIVTIVLHGVPHHALGTWHRSKKAAQNDTADRVLVLLHQVSKGAPTEFLQHQTGPGWEVATLQEYCKKKKANAELVWQFDRDDNKFKALAQIDTERRTLHYLTVPGFEGCFELGPDAPSAATHEEILAPPQHWIGGETVVEETMCDCNHEQNGPENCCITA